MTSLDEIRSTFAGLHFAKEALRPHELQTLYAAEELMRRVDAVLEMHSTNRYSEGNCGECYPEKWPCDTVKALRGNE